MCTIGGVNSQGNNLLFKNLDPRRGYSFEEWVSRYEFGKLKILVVRNSIGCYGGLSSQGIGIVGTFVNIKEQQHNYFDGDTLIDILKLGDASAVLRYLQDQDELYGNLLLSSCDTIWAIELAGQQKDICIVDRYVMTNHFQKLQLQLRTYSDPLIRNWTTLRLQRAKLLIKTCNSIDRIKELLSDHMNSTDYSICNHGKIATASSYILDINNLVLYYCHGNPCCNNYEVYSF